VTLFFFRARPRQRNEISRALKAPHSFRPARQLRRVPPDALRNSLGLLG